MRSQRAQRDAQALKVARLRERVDALTLKSPVAGMGATLSQAERAQVAENAPLVTVVDLTRSKSNSRSPKSYANEIRSGMNAEIALDGRQFTGTVAGISPDVRNAQVTGRVRFAEQPKGLRQNQRASVRVVLDERNDVLKGRLAAPSATPTPALRTWCVTTPPFARPWNSARPPSAKSKSATNSMSATTVVLSDMRELQGRPQRPHR